MLFSSYIFMISVHKRIEKREDNLCFSYPIKLLSQSTCTYIFVLILRLNLTDEAMVMRIW